jgi:hypothetical protein
MWKGNSYSAGSAAFTFAKFQSALSDACNKGLTEDGTVLVSPKTWTNLHAEQSALRDYDSSYSSGKATNGSKALQFFSQNGSNEIIAHPFVKEGEAFVYPAKRIMRLGATDITFNNPANKEKIFIDLENYIHSSFIRGDLVILWVEEMFG